MDRETVTLLTAVVAQVVQGVVIVPLHHLPALPVLLPAQVVVDPEVLVAVDEDNQFEIIDY